MLTDEKERARMIAAVVYAALERAPVAAVQDQTSQRPPCGGAGASLAQRFTVSRQGGCLACDPGACSECGYLFSGERIIINHAVQGERVISDRTLHLLTHGISKYQTKYVVYGEPVVVDLDLDELASYLDL